MVAKIYSLVILSFRLLDECGRELRFQCLKHKKKKNVSEGTKVNFG